MGKLIVSEFITVDGVVEDPGGSEGFERGGWALEIPRGDEGDKFKYDEVMAADALLLGRRTYEGFAEAWPEREGEFADKFNSMPKYVVSTTLDNPSWNNTHTMGGDLTAEVNWLKETFIGDVLVNGSVELVRALGAAGLIDELRLMVFPVVLGAGKRLFGEEGEPAVMKLAESRAVGDGVIIAIYRP
jgi:dihydrofolate reductase